MILCVTPNPAVDRSFYVRSIQLGGVHRAEKVLAAAGGKGLNVARTIRTLGGAPLCMGPTGGHTGNLLADLARQEGLRAQWTRVQNESRTCMILVQENFDATVINEPGGELTARECDALIDDVCSAASRVNFVCICGSLPPGFSIKQYGSLLSRLVSMGRPVWVDTSGESLKTALKVRGVCIKVNAAELGAAAGLEILNAEGASKTMRPLLDGGIAQLALTLGGDGGLLCAAAGTWMARPPRIGVVSSVGSGDAFLGGLLFAMENGAHPEAALRAAVAAGAANALEFGGGVLSKPVFEKMVDEVKVTSI